MIEFALTVTLLEGTQKEGQDVLDRLYRKEKIQWPVLPRKDEWFEIADLAGETAVPIVDVWHWAGKNGTPNIQLELSVHGFEFERLAAMPGWTVLDPF